MEAKIKYDLIDQYLKGELTEQERTVFESEISCDTDLKHLVLKQRFVNDIIVENRLYRLQMRIKADIQLGFADELILKKMILRRLSLGIISALILIAGYSKIF